MKSHPRAQEAAEPAEARRREPARAGAPEYTLEASWYCTMRPGRVYPLVVRVPPGQGSVPIESPSGVVATLQPVVPGALVAPAELPLELSRPGAQVTFHVTPLARGRLPAARVRVLCGGRQVHELPVRMTAKTQRLAWVLLLLALVAPPFLLRYTHPRFEPLRGQVTDTRRVLQKDGAEEGEVKTEEWRRPGTPGEVLHDRIRSWLGAALPEFPGSRRFGDGLGRGAGAVYDFLCNTADTLYPPFWIGVLLCIMAFGAWALHRPARVRDRGRVGMAGVVSAVRQHGDATAETLPLAPPSET
jgi:hypothetical protein